jgi:photosystem II stability/assembly factor-like uncharacterized protein
MKLFFTLTCLFFPFISSHAQWQKIGSGTTQDLYDIQMKGRVGYIAGHNSTILKSTDSGKSWKGLALSIPSHLRALYFIDSSVGFVTGENARVQKTIDGGKTWSQKYAQTAAYAFAMTFNNNFGIAVGDDMLAIRSANSGETWTVDTTFHSGAQLNSVCILPGGMCWAVGDSGYILKKHVSGKKWTIVASPTNMNLNYICNIGDSVLIATGSMTDSAHTGIHQNILLRSTDSGKTWASIQIPEMKTIKTAWFFNKDTGFLAGGSGLVERCYDPFVKRNRQLSGTASTLNKLFFYGETGFAVGDGGTFCRTFNSGGFGLGISQVTNPAQAIFYPNPSTGMITLNASNEIQALSIYDIYGRCIRVYNNEVPQSFYISQKGNFLLSVEFKDGRKSEQKVSIP